MAGPVLAGGDVRSPGNREVNMQSPPPPPAFVDPPKSPSRFSARRVGLALAALVVVAALSFFIVDDLGQRADVHTLQDRVASVRASASAQQTSDQATIAALQGLIPTEPDFVLAGSGWQGACTSDSCTPDASFINRGKAGEAVATFNIHGGSTSTGSMLASCTAALPMTPANGSADATCTASSASLQTYFENQPSGTVSEVVSVVNP